MANRTQPATAAIVVVGSELVEGASCDTNGSEVARALAAAGYIPAEIRALPDDRATLAAHLADAIERHDVVVVTGGLGPTHDDITREAAADACGSALVKHPPLLERLKRIAAGHRETAAAGQAMRQALVLEGATVLEPAIGTAPGQVVKTKRGHLILLPGPPREMRPLLAEALAPITRGHRSPPSVLRCVGLRESDAQLLAQRALGDRADIRLTVLGKPGLVDVVLIDEGAGPIALSDAARDVAAALGSHCYSTDGTSLAGVVLREAAARSLTLGTAESCTGGLIAAALTDEPGSSAVFLGSIVSYADSIKTALLGVPESVLADDGAVSESCAMLMAQGARKRLGVDLAVAVTGIAGPTGGTAEKPVGLAWFACTDAAGTTSFRADFAGDRAGIRARATVAALEMFRTALRDRP